MKASNNRTELITGCSIFFFAVWYGVGAWMLPKVKLPSVYVEPLEAGADGGEPAARVAGRCLAAEARTGGFSEVELCIGEEDAVREARRCLRCDLEFTQRH